MQLLLSCGFIFDTTCVELKLSDGTMIAVDTIAIENNNIGRICQKGKYSRYFLILYDVLHERGRISFLCIRVILRNDRNISFYAYYVH